MSLQSTTSVAIAPAQQHCREDLPPLPPPPLNPSYRPTHQYQYMNSVGIVNRHATLYTLIDAAYPKNHCSICDSTFNSGSEADQHYKSHHSQGYLCLYPHCDQVFRTRGVLRFHIASCHIVVNEQVPKTDPLYLLYAPSDSLTHISIDSRDPSGMVVPKKRKYERRQKVWNPVGKSSLPGQTNFTLLPPIDQQPPKRRGRPPKNKTIEKTAITPSPPPPLVPEPKVFRLVQQVIPSSTQKGRANLSLLSKTLLAEKYNPLRCPSCQLGFKRKTNVVKHLASAHPGEECFQCVYTDCDHPKRFSTREGLVYHILRMHDHDHRPYDSSEDTVDEDITKSPILA